MGKKRILAIGDGVAATGFSTVMHNILGNLPRKDFEVHHLAVNYSGDPHEYDWKIYPAHAFGSDLLGMKRLPRFAENEFDGIFILNDVWVIDKYLEVIKSSFKKIPPIIVYFPVDSKYLDPDWFKHFDIVSEVCVYTQFGYDEVKRVYDREDINIIPHGIDHKSFFRLDSNREKIKKMIFPDREDFTDSFIVLNANRNQPRKRIDLTIQGFALFAQDKPSNVKLYLHMGSRDVGWDIFKLTARYEVSDRLIVTNLNHSIQQVPIDKLNAIYNACEVGINTSIGEGWGLTSVEHAATGAVQIVPDHSSCRELFYDCGLVVPVNQPVTSNDTLTEGGLISPKGLADSLNNLYYDREMLRTLSNKCYNKFFNEQYSWKKIVQDTWLPIFHDTF